MTPTRPPFPVLIDYIASYKLSMVHKLCSSERYTPQHRPVATRTLRSPRLGSLCLDKDLLSQLCDQIPGFRENIGGNWREEKKNSKHAAFSVPVIQACRDDTDSQWKTEQITPTDSERLTDPVEAARCCIYGTFLMFCKGKSRKLQFTKIEDKVQHSTGKSVYLYWLKCTV